MKIFSSMPVLPEIASALDETLDSLFPRRDRPSLRFAVRSSALGEDSEELSAAGQNETVLGCRADKVFRTKKIRCILSQFEYALL